MSARWVGIYNAPGAVTLSGLAFAMTSCACAISGRFELAVIGLIFAGLCDLFDGVVARRRQLDEEARGFGVELDSVVDMASFGVTPVVLALSAGVSGPVGLGILVLYACAAAQRLAYFNIHGIERIGGNPFYEGLPVTYVALIFPVAFAARGPLGDLFPLCLSGLFLTLAVAFVVRIPIPKPRGFAYAGFSALAVGLIGYWLLEHMSQ